MEWLLYNKITTPGQKGGKKDRPIFTQISLDEKR